MTATSDLAPAQDETPGSLMASRVGHMITMIERNLGNGERAELRRADPEEPYSSALWRMLASRDDLAACSDDEARRWGIFLGALIHGYAYHDAGVSLGGALFEAGYSEARLTRLLRADEDRLTVELRNMARFLGSKQQAANWIDVARFYFSDPEEDQGKQRRRSIARAYFAAEYHASH